MSAVRSCGRCDGCDDGGIRLWARRRLRTVPRCLERIIGKAGKTGDVKCCLNCAGDVVGNVKEKGMLRERTWDDRLVGLMVRDGATASGEVMTSGKLPPSYVIVLGHICHRNY